MRDHRTTVSEIVEAACAHQETTSAELMSGSRITHISQARALAGYLIRRISGRSLAGVALDLGLDPSSVLYGVRRVERDPALLQAAQSIERQLEVAKCQESAR